MSKTKKCAKVIKGDFKQCRTWCFTDFQNDCAKLKKVFDMYYPETIRGMAWGIEICPTTGKEHRQGFIQFVNKKRLQGVQKFFGHKIHVETVKGAIEDNERYCSKDGKYVKYGKFISQGYRTDLENIQREINNGANVSDIMENHFDMYCRYRGGIRDYCALATEKRADKWRDVEVTVIFGDTGVGKTRAACEYDPDCYKIEGDNLQWWDGYRGQKTLVIDEYYNQLKITKLLNILDDRKLRLDIKGSHTYAFWNKVIITSNVNPREWHQQALPQHLEALERRLAYIIHKTKDIDYTLKAPEKCANLPLGNTNSPGAKKNKKFKLTLDLF